MYLWKSFPLSLIVLLLRQHVLSVTSPYPDLPVLSESDNQNILPQTGELSHLLQKKRYGSRYKEQREFETIDDDIAKLEEKLETLDAQIAANATNSVKLRELMDKKEEAGNELDEKMERWVYLNDLNEKIQNADITKE